MREGEGGGEREREGGGKKEGWKEGERRRGEGGEGGRARQWTKSTQILVHGEHRIQVSG
jgi:hypothetical protein